MVMTIPEIRPGTLALELVLSLPKVNSLISTLQFKTYSPLPILEERLVSSKDEAVERILEEASNLRTIASKNLFPYWESVLIAALATDKNEMFVREAAKHDPNNEAIERFELSVNDLVDGALQGRIEALSENEVIALCSTCTLVDGSTRHIPMMDYRILPDSKSVCVVKEALNAIDRTNGVILKSGRSYHFYGFDLLRQNDWIKFLARSLLLAPLTDSRYIAHRLLEGAGALRITSSKLKPNVPIVELCL